jgi:hypothetical protein
VGEQVQVAREQLVPQARRHPLLRQGGLTLPCPTSAPSPSRASAPVKRSLRANCRRGFWSMDRPRPLSLAHSHCPLGPHRAAHRRAACTGPNGSMDGVSTGTIVAVLSGSVRVRGVRAGKHHSRFRRRTRTNGRDAMSWESRCLTFWEARRAKISPPTCLGRERGAHDRPVHRRRDTTNRLRRLRSLRERARALGFSLGLRPNPEIAPAISLVQRRPSA